MAATVQYNEYNTVGETKTGNLSTGHYRGATDSPNLADPVDDPIEANANSYEKWWKMEATAMGGASKLDTFRIHMSTGSVPGNTDYMTSADATTPSNPVFATPTTSTSSVAVYAMPTSDPAVETITGSLTAIGETSYFVQQIQVGVSETTSEQTGEVTTSWREIS